jgi:hypothetical protein
MKTFTQWLERDWGGVQMQPAEMDQGGIVVYHGSGSSDLKKIRASVPSYPGHIGDAAYVGVYPETAEFYGKHVYKLRTNFGWDKVLRIGEENYEIIEELEGHSILVGEHIPLFSFWVKDKKYSVTSRTGWRSLNDIYQIEVSNLGEEIGLEDIAEIIRASGYKAVYLVGIRHGSTVNEEMAVFNENDLTLLEQIKWQPQVAPAERQIEERQKLHENNARTLYHVTHKKHVAKIRSEGLVPMQTSNWAMGDSDIRYGRGEIYAFESRKDAIKWGLKMEYEFYKKFGEGNIYLISLLEKGEWEVDESEESVGSEGKWLKKMEHVPPSDIIDDQPIDQELAVWSRG